MCFRDEVPSASASCSIWAKILLLRTKVPSALSSATTPGTVANAFFNLARFTSLVRHPNSRSISVFFLSAPQAGTPWSSEMASLLEEAMIPPSADLADTRISPLAVLVFALVAEA